MNPMAVTSEVVGIVEVWRTHFNFRENVFLKLHPAILYSLSCIICLRVAFSKEALILTQHTLTYNVMLRIHTISPNFRP
jgi:hypothetical protein